MRPPFRAEEDSWQRVNYCQKEVVQTIRVVSKWKFVHT